MRNKPQTFLRNQFSCHTANAECLVFDPKQRILEVHDELLLTRCQLGSLLPAHRIASVLHHFKCGSGVFRPIVVLVRQGALQLVKVRARLLQLGVDERLKLLKI